MFKNNITISAIGIIFLCLGLFLQVLGFKTLGIKAVFGIPEILSKKEKGILIINGPFLLVRHPLYLGQLFLIIGLLLLTFELSLFLLLAIVIIFVWPVTILEEKELIERFGQAYIDYQKRVPRILPGLGIIKFIFK
jgi:protein-S-isoprenylcysteine O-methyltransferase Ste14